MLKIFMDNDNKDKEQEPGSKGKFIRLTPKQKKQMLPLIVCLVVGILLMSLGAVWGNDTSQDTKSQNQSATDNSKTTDTQASNEDKLAKNLESILGKIAGVGEVNVYISYAEGERAEYAVDATTTTRTVEEKNNDGSTSTTSEVSQSGQTVMGNNEPVLVKEDMAEIQGVLVVAEGAENLEVKADLSQAIQRLLGVPAHRIQISPAG